MTVESQTSSGFSWPKVGSESLGRSYWDRSEPETSPSLPANEPQASKKDDGFEQGLAEGRAAGAAEYDRLLSTMQSTLEALEKSRTELTQAVLADAAVIVKQMFASIFRVELQTNPHVLEQLQELACQGIDEQTNKIRIGISQEDYQRLGEDVIARFGDRISPEHVSLGTVRVSLGSLVREINVASNLEQLLTAGVTEIDGE